MFIDNQREYHHTEKNKKQKPILEEIEGSPPKAGPPRAEKKINIRSKISRVKLLKYLPYVLSKKERGVLILLLLAIVISFFFLGVRYYKGLTQEVPRHGGYFTEGTVGQPKLVNPILCQTNDVDMDLSMLIYSGLIKYNSSGELIPDLAEGYEISEDGKNYIFHLRRNIKWHDDFKLTADDVIFTVELIKNPEYKSPLYPNFQGVAIEKVDDFTLKFVLDEPFSPFLYEQTIFGILPKHIWENVLPENFALAEYNLRPIGTGPYQFEEYKKDKQGNINSYVLVLNENYHLDKPFLEKITFLFFEDEADLIQAFQDKEITGVSYIPAEYKKDLEKEGINFYSVSLPKFYALFFNQPKNEHLKNKEVRKALAYAIDKQEIIDKALNGQAVPAHTPILPGFLGHNPEIKKYEYNQKRALELLNKAGWKDTDEEGNRLKEGQPLEIIITSVDQPPFPQVLDIIKEAWENIGIKVHIKLYDPAKLQVEYIKPRNYEVLLYGELMMHDPDPWPFWHSSQRLDPGLNLTSFKDEAVDDLLGEARHTLDQDERAKKYLHFQNILAEEIPAIFLYSPTYLYGVDKKIKGIKLDRITFPSDRFAEINMWYVKTKRAWK